MTQVAILWHMHQPFYEDLATHEHLLPWVRLHAIKDYWGMAALLREFPEVRVTFNLVPSLVLQIQAFAEDRAHDRHLAIGLSDAASLSETEQEFLIVNGFHAPVDRMIRPYPRYFELYGRRTHRASWTTRDVRDLQVWHKLAWMDPDWLARDPRLRALIVQGRNYTEHDKRVLRAVELELLQATVPMYREIAATGRIELSTSPLYHAILPLLCDSDVHRRSHPQTAMPERLFARPGDALEQLRRARALHEQVFGAAPRGVWPSEGALSDDVIGLLRQEGFGWTATDQDILAKSLEQPLSADALYHPYEVGPDGQSLRCVFRDHELSDRIGFVYQSWEADAAARDFVERVRDAGRRFASASGRGTDGEVATVNIILDGENAWEHYPEGGRPFLRALYGQLQAALDIDTVTMSEAANGPARRLSRIFPGSWINSDFYIWAGHRDDHRAWAQLAAARAVFDRRGVATSPERRAIAWEELLIAEGSDWFWWYGDDHSSDHDAEFDGLFRRHLRNVYQALGEDVPTELYLTNISSARGSVSQPPQRPARLMTPRLDGPPSFADWCGAASFDGPAGSMHRGSGGLVERLLLAVDRSRLYLRLEGAELRAGVTVGRFGFDLLVDGVVPLRLEILPAPGDGPRWTLVDGVHVEVPFATLRRQAGDPLHATLLILDAERRVVEHHPPSGAIELEIPSRHLNAIHWRV
jgi:alpha-amylase/alpha-mannosidase (GH57 family)